MSSFQTIHKPVLVEEVTSYLVRPNAVIIDGTVGAGGHAELLLKKSGENAFVLGIDLDTDAIVRTNERLAPYGDQFKIVHGTFADIAAIATDQRVAGKVTGVLFDLGMSSMHLEAKRGFSFQTEDELDMRFNANGSIALPVPEHPALQRLMQRSPSYRAQEIIDVLHVDDLADVISSLGGERYARRISQAIVARRKSNPIRSTRDLAHCVVKAIPFSARKGRIHAATRTFQALRMAVNRELESAKAGITGALDIIAPGGRIAVISFHEGEDRIAKHMFKKAATTDRFSILTKKPIVPRYEEQKENPRSRSAKLRVLEAKII